MIKTKVNVAQKALVFCALLVVSPAVSAQESHERYVQRLDGLGLEFSMEAIPGGTFRMGSESGKPDEKPAHEVRVAPFWMATHEVLWDLYLPFVVKHLEVANSEGGVPAEVDAVTRPSLPYIDPTSGQEQDERPAVGMTNYAAVQYCKWLYARTGHFYRLPTEVEWEYACRAGSQSAYHYGDDPSELDGYAWFAGNSEGYPNKVGQKKPNAWGLHDMMGNVAEWTYDQYVADFYERFAGGQVADSPVSEPVRLYPHSVRGGSFLSGADDLRSAARMASSPKWKEIDPQIPKSKWWFTDAPFVGIRVVRPLQQPSREEIEAYYDKPPIKDF